VGFAEPTGFLDIATAATGWRVTKPPQSAKPGSSAAQCCSLAHMCPDQIIFLKTLMLLSLFQRLAFIGDLLLSLIKRWMNLARSMAVQRQGQRGKDAL
jgi:hypothetical protein